MPFLTIKVEGGAALQEKLRRMGATINETVATSIDLVCEETSLMLAERAPRGSAAFSGSASTLPGDAPGHLAESFHTVLEAGEETVFAAVVTTQPAKLKLIREGTGVYGPAGRRITPRRKRALYWEGAPNPYTSVAGMRPNDFVTPVLATVPERLRVQIAEDLRVLLES